MSQVTARGDSKIETTTAPDGSDKKVSDLGDWGTLEVKTFGYHVDSKSDELFKIPGGVITRAPGCFAEAGVNKVTQLRAYTNAYAVNVLLDEKTHPPDPQTEEASASTEEYVVCTFKPGPKFNADSSVTATVLVTHTATLHWSATAIGDPEQYTQSMSARTSFTLNQFGKGTTNGSYVQATGKDIEIERTTKTDVGKDGHLELDKSSKGGLTVSPTGDVGGSADATSNAKLGGTSTSKSSDEEKKKVKRNGTDPINLSDTAVVTATAEQDLGREVRETRRFTVRAGCSTTSTAAGGKNLSEASIEVDGSWEFQLKIMKEGKQIAYYDAPHDHSDQESVLAAAGYAHLQESAQLRHDVLELKRLGSPLVIAGAALGILDRSQLNKLLELEVPPGIAVEPRSIEAMLSGRPMHGRREGLTDGGDE